MKKITVYVVGYEPLPPNGVGGFDWYFEKEKADAKYNVEKLLEADGFIIYRGEVEVSDGAHDEDHGKAITAEVELFLEQMDWENAFVKK